jgi:hypothetical protein
VSRGQSEAPSVGRFAAGRHCAKKRPRSLSFGPRGLNCGCAEFYGVMVTFTVTAGLVTLPEDGVIEMVEACDDGPEPLQPATRMNTSIAPAIPSRVRNRLTEGIMNSSAIAIIMKSTCRSKAGGGAFKDCGGTMNEAAVMEPIAEAPGAGPALVVATEHDVISIAGVQVNATAPVNPPNPVTSTGNVPVAPLATVMVAAEIEKSHAVPARATVCGLPLAVSVTEMALETPPGAVDDVGLNARLRTQVVPPGETVRTTGSVAHVLFVIVNGELFGSAIAETVTGVTVLGLLIVTVCVALVVVRSWPANVRLVGVNAMAAAVALPLPLSATSIGRAIVSKASKICKVVDSAPEIDGVKVTPTVQEALAGTDPAHVPAFVTAKSAVLPPLLDAAGVKATADAVLFVIVTNCGCVAVPISCVPKLMLVGAYEIVGVKGKSTTKALVAPAPPSEA